MQSDKKKVFEAYNMIAGWFEENRGKSLIEKKYLDRLINTTRRNATVLDLGCGTGMPVMDYLLKQGLQVTGVDASSRMLEIARHNLPRADLRLADMRQLSLNQQFDALIAWHSFFHLPPEDQPSMFLIFKMHLKNKGLLLFTSGKEHGEAWGMNGGVNLYHGSLDKREYKALLEANDFRVLQYTEDDPECGNATVWLAQLEL
ncbi:Methyltransferase domain-containing protein [Chitinophaga terrae (ex Kim and Jung 2007)]|uniref:Methyltransferase domain-containing protein n=1 Tax=Chitinophaga terrae (ex Kim and Jung 2007) TaxID=408074 RepID=A0A1H4AWU1_9BACT|nr:class I SAM-dependent methyltransferase [Chitinophaga terrae (ex Kim and Jung 2007)]MDQ0106805.1 SAM-dependent methyltransferase [Chitinophaga terrae (ex Kim and Jung 2007)]GEP89097.1 methyltransferase [Chitinophaga terrae (ex Kim and Jung 2007)]SEA40325.1 Methyltransferase domain-containing protein [Chitinophaga terrae (ex Kim and Jung 2007)]